MSYFVFGPHGPVEVDYRVQDDTLPVLKGRKGKSYRHPDPQHWHLIKKQAKDRDCWRCVTCNSGENLDVHHRIYVRFGRELLEDVYTLCRCCHDLFHTERRAA